MKMAQWTPMRQSICACAEREITDEQHLIIDELKTLIIRKETRISTFQESRSKEIERCY